MISDEGGEGVKKWLKSSDVIYGQPQFTILFRFEGKILNCLHNQELFDITEIDPYIFPFFSGVWTDKDGI